jgi:2-amino-4,5-dihydroxy-6-oxo-7-(phosphonooxy)heptanoate synthase
MQDRTELTGRQRRVRRLAHRSAGTSFIVPLDHSVADGPLKIGRAFGELAAAVARAGADGIIVHKGRVRFLPLEPLRDLALIVHLNGITCHAPDVNEKVLLADVEEAVALGADAVSIHVNMGSETEAAQLNALGRMTGQAARLGMPLLAMIYPRGNRIGDPPAPELIAHAASLGVDLGADIVKVPYTGSAETMAEVVNVSPVPVLAAGGSSLGDDDKLVSRVRQMMASGVNGVALGRNIFLSDDPERTVRRVADVVHADT